MGSDSKDIDIVKKQKKLVIFENECCTFKGTVESKVKDK